MGEDVHAPLMKLMTTGQAHHPTNTFHVLLQADDAFSLSTAVFASPFGEAGEASFFFFCSAWAFLCSGEW